VCGAGDINGDGFADLVVGAPTTQLAGVPEIDGTWVGTAAVVHGSDIPFSPVVDIASLDVSDGFQFDGILAHSAVGRALCAAGDMNSDGIDDVVIAAP